MREWLTVELLLGTLLVTTFTSVGLLALWVATSSRRWFVRTATALVLLSPLLVIPAQGAFLMCWFTVWLVAVPVAIYRRGPFAKHTRPAGEVPRVPWQFSIKSALIICTFTSMTLAVIASVADDTSIWPIVALSALASAYVTLLAASVVSGPTKLRTRIAGATFFTAAICAAAVYCKLSLRTPVPFVGSTLLDAFLISNENQTPLLLAVIGATFVVTVLTLLILAPGLSYTQSDEQPVDRRLYSQPLAAIWVFLILAPPALALGMLLKPLHEPDNTLPVPSGYDQLVAIGLKFEKSSIQNELWADRVDKAKLFAAVPNYAAQFDDLHSALKVPFRIPVSYNIVTDIDTDGTMALRRLEKVLNVKGAAALQAGNVAESLACRSDVLKLAELLHQGGLLIHTIMSAAIEQAAVRGIYKSLPHMNSEQCKAAIRELTEYDRRREPWSDAIHREKVWIRKTSGWLGALGYEIQILSNDDGPWGTLASARGPHPRVQTLCHLLIAELAIRAYQLHHGEPPPSPADLVPEYLANFPNDPYGRDSHPLRSAFANGQLKVWSLGEDGDDDGGKPLPRDSDGFAESSGDGDLWLADFFAPDEF